MTDYFVLPDALAGSSSTRGGGDLEQHEVLVGDKPSLSVLMTGNLNPYSCGVLLGLYEHRVVVEGYLNDAGLCSKNDSFSRDIADHVKMQIIGHRSRKGNRRKD